MDDGNQAAVATHNALHWQQEAERLNALVHALRRELEAAKNTAGRTVIQSLLTALEHCEPFVRASRNNFSSQRVHDALAEVAKVRAATVAALVHIQ
jgi:thioredoxin-like negative regulator of GroEL